VTKWGDTTQLFVEFPALVVGEESPFSAHLTRLADHFAIDRGTVTVELTGGQQAIERFTISGPVSPGIFRPVVTPAHTGERTVTLRLDSAAASEVHEVGNFTVFETREAAEAASDEPAEDAEAISFLLEQQWPVRFHIEQLELRSMRPSVPAFAELVRPSDSETIVTAPRDGRLVAIGGRFPVVGEAVAADEPMFSLGVVPQDDVDPASIDLAVDRASVRARAAQREVDRLEPLVEQGVVAQRRLDEAQSELSAARAELRSARRQRENLGQSQRVEGDGESIDIPSPISGDVAELHVAPGAWVSAGDPLARVVDGGSLWLDVAVPEAYLGRLGNVSGVWFELENFDGAFELGGGALVSIGTEVDPTTRTLPVRFAIDNVRRELFAGMTMRAHIVVEAPQLTVAIPTDAIVDDAGTDVVYVQTSGETFARRPVRLGIRDSGYVEAISGVSAGEWIVAEGAWSVKLAATSTDSIGHGHAH